MTKWLAKLFKTDERVISWALYDWANSACATTIMAGFVPAFLKDYWSLGVDPTLTTARLGITNSVTSILVAAVAPMLGALADQRGYKKLFCFLFMLVGAVCCVLLAFIPKGDWLSALIVFGILMIGFNASLVFYDSLLPSVAKASAMDHASSVGYGFGYLGGGVLFLLNIVMVSKPELFGLTGPAEAVQASFISVAIWWLVFSIPLFRRVPEPQVPNSKENLFAASAVSFQKMWMTFKALKANPNLLRFLLAFWLYIDGVYTVMTMAVDFGKSLQLQTTDLMAALLIVQFIGFPFALVFSKLSERWGCRVPILIAVAVYGVAVILSTQMSSATHFYALAVMIGVVQGGVQALSRSLFGRMIPRESAGEYFGLFNLLGKFASILGPLIVGLGAYYTGDPGKGMMGLLILFVIGGALLWTVKEPLANDAV